MRIYYLLTQTVSKSINLEFLFNFFTSLIVWLATEQKEKLSEVEQQLKKSEAAQRRKMQVEKAARESEVPLSSSILSLSFFFLSS